jgi:hemoglobin-like flavoprotein
MDESTLTTFEDSLQRCNAQPRFLDRFYEIFLASSPRVEDKFAKTDFVRQKRALRASLYLILLAATGGRGGPDRYLRDIAALHSARQLDIGAELYDLWLDSLLATVKECDPEHSFEVAAAWEAVMMVGIRYMCTRYNQ